jgi:hypothetical protein
LQTRPPRQPADPTATVGHMGGALNVRCRVSCTATAARLRAARTFPAR